jgi:CubicO group peptidase (beta-lactamase class C family)
MNKKDKIEKTLDKFSSKKYIKGLGFNIYDFKSNESILQTKGNIKKDSQFFIASTTKLFTSAIIIQLIEEGSIAYSTKIVDILDSTTIHGLNVLNNKDYSNEITIKHLLAHTSGLPNYFSEHRYFAKSLEQQLISNIDTKYTFEDTIKWSKKFKPKFIPGAPNKAYYSDTNYQLLGRIIELLSGKSFEQNINFRIISKLGLKNTYLYSNVEDSRPIKLNYKEMPLDIPKAMSSFGPDGGVVSSLDDLMVFIKAFFKARLFSKQGLNKLYEYNKIFFPLEYGIGHMRFKLPKYMTAFRNVPESLGHSGLSGALAYYCPEKEVYIVGTVNQIYKPRTSYDIMTRILMSL